MMELKMATPIINPISSYSSMLSYESLKFKIEREREREREREKEREKQRDRQKE